MDDEHGYPGDDQALFSREAARQRDMCVKPLSTFAFLQSLAPGIEKNDSGT